jgi:DNA-binding transcriptional LysR family regulator
MGVDTETKKRTEFMLRANLNDIQVFMAVVDAGSFIAGGKAMGLSRSAAGKAVMRLEDRLGVRLLHRATRTIGVTEEGRLLYERGLQILASVDEAEASVAGKSGLPRGVLRLTLPDAYGRRVLLPIVAAYMKNWPEVQVEVSFTDRIADIVEDGFDLAVRIGVTSQDSSFVSRVVARCRAMLCASPAYIAERGDPADLDELMDHDCLVHTSRNQRQAWRFPVGQGGSVKAQGRSRLRLDSGEALLDAARAGLGIAYLPDFLIDEDLAAGRLRRVLPEQDSGDVPILALYPDKRLLEPRVRRFIDLMVEKLGA